MALRELALSAGRPSHPACYDTRLQNLEQHVLATLSCAQPPCRSCVARALDVALDDVYAVTGRLLARRAVRGTAAYCPVCRRPSLVLVATAPSI